MVDGKKPDFNFDDWDSLPVAPDNDWDGIPLPKTDSSARADELGSKSPSALNQPDLAETKAPQARSIDLNIDDQRPGGAAGTDRPINSILTDDGDLNEDFDDLIDISTDVDDIDVGEPSAVTEAALTVAEPAVVLDKLAQPLPEALKAAEPLAPEESAAPGERRSFGFEKNSRIDISSFGDLGLTDQDELNNEKQRPSFEAHLTDDLGRAGDELESEINGTALSVKPDGPDSGAGVSSAPSDGDEYLSEAADVSYGVLKSSTGGDSAVQAGLPAGNSFEIFEGNVEGAQASPNTNTLSPLPSSLSSDLRAVQKVELDIEGIFLDDQGQPTEGRHEAPSEANDNAPPEEPPPVDEPKQEPAPVEIPPPVIIVAETTAPVGGLLKGWLARLKSLPGNLKNIPKPKLALILLPVFLIPLAATFGIYKLLFTSGDTSSASVLIIDPEVPPRAAEPGVLDLGVFYVAFPGEPGAGEIIAEISFAVHYRDISDKVSLEDKITQARDIIYRSALGKGGQLVASGEAQRDLKEELTSRLNNIVGGGEHVEYVQIGQIRILR